MKPHETQAAADAEEGTGGSKAGRAGRRSSKAIAVVLVVIALLASAAAGSVALSTVLGQRPPPVADLTALEQDASPEASPPASADASPEASPGPSPQASPGSSSPSAAESATPADLVPLPDVQPPPSRDPIVTPPPSRAGTGAGAGGGAALDVGPSDSLRLLHLETITGGLAPKSVVSSQTGYFVAQNMMYRHTVSVYDRDFALVRTIRDRVDLSRFGHAVERTVVQGAPVEAAFTPDGGSAYISQYTMYGPGFERPGGDTCDPAEERDPSFVYRIDMERLRIDQMLPVGATPKYLAVSPDGDFLLVANWCSYDLSVFDLTTGEEIRRLPIGPYPRGITFSPDARTAYIAVMGSTWIGALDMHTLQLSRIDDVGIQPRHLVMDPGGRYLYASLDEEASVVKIDLATGREVARTQTGDQPRSMDIAPDGRSLYVVEYTSDSAAKIRTDTMEVIQRVETRHHPIGISYDIATRQVWIACYSGVIQVFRDV